MQEDWEQQYSDHLPLYFNGLNLHMTDLLNYNTQFIKEWGWLTPWRTLFPSAPITSSVHVMLKSSSNVFSITKREKLSGNLFFHTHASTLGTSLMYVQYSSCHFCLLHFLSGTLQWRKWKKKKKIKNIKLNSWSFFFSLC